MRAEGLRRALAGLDSLALRRGREPDQPTHLLTGIEGEEAACFYLLRQGYTVAWQGPVLCFFEVKTRTARDLAPAETSVDMHKRKMLRRLVRQYMRQLPDGSSPQARFDVISVYLEPGKAAEFEHFESAFGWREPRGRERND